MDGQLRVDAPDVSADEHNRLPIVRGPLGPQTTGPDWLHNTNIPTILTLQKVGSGRVVADPAGGVYDAGTVVTLNAVPDSGWRFLEWQGDVISGDNPVQFTMDGSKTVKAVFEIDAAPTFVVNVFVFSGGGTVPLDPPGPGYPANTPVQITAVPHEGWEFSGWGGDWTGVQNPDTIVVNGNMSILATFKKLSNGLADRPVPVDFMLSQNYPNPFNPTTEIAYSLPISENALLSIYNSLGQQVTVLVNEPQNAGVYRVVWDGRASDGRLVDSGLYYYRLQAGVFQDAKKMMFIR